MKEMKKSASKVPEWVRQVIQRSSHMKGFGEKPLWILVVVMGFILTGLFVLFAIRIWSDGASYRVAVFLCLSLAAFVFAGSAVIAHDKFIMRRVARRWLRRAWRGATGEPWAISSAHSELDKIARSLPPPSYRRNELVPSKLVERFDLAREAATLLLENDVDRSHLVEQARIGNVR